MAEFIGVDTAINNNVGGSHVIVRRAEDHTQGWQKFYPSQSAAEQEAVVLELASLVGKVDAQRHTTEQEILFGRRQIDPTELPLHGFVPLAVSARLRNLAGKRGLLKIKGNGELPFTITRVLLSEDGLEISLDKLEFQAALSATRFVVRFDPEVMVDGQNTMEVSGAHFSKIDLPY